MKTLHRWYGSHFKTLGVVSILLCIGTWAIDLIGLTQPCTYCRTQRTAIGLVGVLMLLPDPRLWWVRWLGGILCFFGAHVASGQVFLILYAADAGGSLRQLNLLLAGAALVILTGQALLLFSKRTQNQGSPEISDIGS